MASICASMCRPGWGGARYNSVCVRTLPVEGQVIFPCMDRHLFTHPSVNSSAFLTLWLFPNTTLEFLESLVKKKSTGLGVWQGFKLDLKAHITPVKDFSLPSSVYLVLASLCLCCPGPVSLPGCSQSMLKTSVLLEPAACHQASPPLVLSIAKPLPLICQKDRVG